MLHKNAITHFFLEEITMVSIQKLVKCGERNITLEWSKVELQVKGQEQSYTLEGKKDKTSCIIYVSQKKSEEQSEEIKEGTKKEAKLEKTFWQSARMSKRKKNKRDCSFNGKGSVWPDEQILYESEMIY